MANATDIQKYLMEGDTSYFKQNNRNGEILMLSGVWGSGKTHFWKNDIEKQLIKQLKEKEKSYVFISLYGKDSIEELQNEIFQLSYSFAQKDNDVISSAYSVFTKVTSFMPKISLFGLEVELDKSAEKVSAENMKQQIEKGIDRLRNGGIICFDDFERKSSKIDLNDLFGFITNLTEVFKTKTVIITNQEFFKENDSEVFSRIKEKSVNKFLLLDPTVDELFETIYAEKYTELDEYKDTILEAIKITEEKNARIFIQVLDNCLEYYSETIEKKEIRYLVLLTILFVKHNFIFKMYYLEQYKFNGLIPEIIKEVPTKFVQYIVSLNRNIGQSEVLQRLKENYENTLLVRASVEVKKEYVKFVDDNQDMLLIVYKYFIDHRLFSQNDLTLIHKISNYVESGILPNE